MCIAMGECVSVFEPSDILDDKKESWNEWREDLCSGCLQKSEGVRIRQRFCENRDRRAANYKRLYYDIRTKSYVKKTKDDS
jgi:hypothetical protein